MSELLFENAFSDKPDLRPFLDQIQTRLEGYAKRESKRRYYYGITDNLPELLDFLNKLVPTLDQPDGLATWPSCEQKALFEYKLTSINIYCAGGEIHTATYAHKDKLEENFFSAIDNLCAANSLERLDIMPVKGFDPDDMVGEV